MKRDDLQPVVDALKSPVDVFIPFRVQGSNIALVRRAPACALKERADTQVCPYRDS